MKMGILVPVIVLIIVFVLSYLVYRSNVLRSKLSWMACVPGFPLLGNSLLFKDTTTSDLLQNLSNITAKYGKMVFLEVATIPTILVADYDLTEFVLSSKDILTKSHDYGYLTDWLGAGLLTNAGTMWKARRKLITPAFHFSILEQFVESFESNGKVLIHKLKQQLGKPIDIDEYMTLYALDVICETAMGVKINAQEDSQSQYVKAVKESCRIVIEKSFSISKRIPFVYRFSKDYRIEKESLKYLHSVTNSVIDSRFEKLKNKTATEDNDDDGVGAKKKMAFLEVLLQSTIDGESLSREDIREEVDTFMFAGHDTTATAMTFILYNLSINQEAQQQAFDEQKLIFGDDQNRNVTYQDLQDMKYLECVIKESLRLYPSVPVIGRYIDKDTYYKDNLLPEGVSVTICMYQILRDPENFPDPDKFDPNRFVENAHAKRPYAYIPFSAGPRNCIGQKFAMMEMKTALSKILRTFKILPCPEHKLKVAFEVVIKSLTGVKVRLEERKW